MLRRFLRNYLARHRRPSNQILHLVGVPLTFLVSVAMLAVGRPAWAVGCFVVGYLFQFLGHAIEGNDAGEIVVVRRLLGLPYREFGPASRPSPAKSVKS